MYDKKSLKAEEFINHEEVLRTLEYAEKNKNNLELINEILEKARPTRVGRDTFCKVTMGGDQRTNLHPHPTGVGTAGTGVTPHPSGKNKGRNKGRDLLKATEKRGKRDSEAGGP